MSDEIRPGHRGLGALVAGVLVVGLLAGPLAAGGAPEATHPSSTVDFVNVSATSSYQFQPAQFYVYPGALVELAVTQLADFPHTFTLSSVRNATIDPSLTPAQLYQYFQTNAPILNLTLGSTVGGVTRATFTAPAIGVYEFVCTEPGHFQGGMNGFMNSTTTPPSTGSSSSTPVVMYVEIGGAVGAVVVLVAVLALVRRGRKQRGPPAAPPSK